MNLSTGIIGLPNVGKSTIFNAITNSQVEAANYPFATIEPNVGIVNLPDMRLERLAELVRPEKIVYSTVKFVDIAGLVKGASKGEGLGNKFLKNIADVDALIHVVRCFDDPTITHVSNRVSPIDDVEVINLELILADLEIISNRIDKIRKLALSSTDKKAKYEFDVLNKIYDALSHEKKASTVQLDEDELKVIIHFNLITMKPLLYVANISENDILNYTENVHYQALLKFANQENSSIVAISAKIECEISQLSDDNKNIFMHDLGLQEPGLNRLIVAAFKLLKLSTYFTAGKKEVRSWIFKNGSTAPVCAGIIHSDFERGFIKAEIIHYNDFIQNGGEVEARKLGKLRQEGKTYIMQDGDICNFKFNV